jgi:hypothetical protein
MWRPPCVVMPPTQLKHWLWSVSLMLQKNEKTLADFWGNSEIADFDGILLEVSIEEPVSVPLPIC